MGSKGKDIIKKTSVNIDFFNSTIVKGIQKEYGISVCTPLTEIDDMNRGIVKTRPSLDLALGSGLLMANIVQIAGKPKSGKTSLCFDIAASFHRQFPEAFVFYLKVEGRLSSSLVKAVKGLDQSRFFVIQSTEKKILDGCDFLTIQEKLMVEHPNSMFIVDSIGGLSMPSEISGELRDQSFGGASKLLARWLRRIAGVVGVTNSLILLTNHVRSSMGSKGQFTTGGNHLAHALDTNCWIKDSYPVSKIEDSNGEQIGKYVDIEIKTSILNKPSQSVTLPLIFGRGYVLEYDIANLAIEIGVIEKGGSWYTIDEEHKYQGYLKLVAALEDDKDLFEKVKRNTFETMGMQDEADKY